MEPRVGMCLLSYDGVVVRASAIMTDWVDEPQFDTSRGLEISVLTLLIHGDEPILKQKGHHPRSCIQLPHTPHTPDALKGSFSN